MTFWLAGNSVDGGGANDDSDHWNLLSFVVNEPGATDAQSEAGLSTRVISVGDYDSLFVSEEDPEQLERERQAELADGVFSTGNTLYFTSLLALIIGAVFQREFPGAHAWRRAAVASQGARLPPGSPEGDYRCLVLPAGPLLDVQR